MKNLFLLNSYCFFYGIPQEVEMFSFRVNNSKNYFFISNSIFQKMLVHENGGAIQIMNTLSKLLIEKSMFYSCMVSNFSGGALFLSCDESIINFLCASHCSTYGSPDLTSQYNGMFGKIITSKNKRNIFNYSTIQLCAEKIIYNKNRVDCLILSSENQNLYYFNSSKNFLHRYCSITFLQLDSLNSSFCNYFNGSCRGFGVVLFYSGTMNNLLSFSNFIKNFQVEYGIIRSHSNSKSFIRNCIFLENNNYLFYSQSGGFISIFNCYLIHSSSLYGSGSISYFQIINSMTNTFKISLLSLYSCNAINSLSIITFSNCLFTNIKVNTINYLLIHFIFSFKFNSNFDF